MDTNNSILVSDSIGAGASVWNSRQVTWEDFSHIAEEYLFSNYLTILNGYLTNNGYDQYCASLTQSYNETNEEFERVKDLKWSGKYKVVDGQVILLKKSELTSGISPLNYIQEHWNITSDYYVEELKDCMLRGVTFINSTEENVVCNGANEKQSLNEENFPQHMHHDAMTTGSGMNSIKVDTSSKTMCDGTYRYDMFNNDSYSTGLSKNELQGSTDTFSVQSTGGEEGEVTHNNLPNIQMYYVFVIHKKASI